MLLGYMDLSHINPLNMKTQNRFNNILSDQENQNSAIQLVTEPSKPISFQKRIDSIIYELSHSSRISNKERYRELMDRASFLIHEYNTFK